MAQNHAVEVNKFVGGLITDASPLTSPDNSSYNEDNFVLDIDGSRRRRFGMDYEEDFANIPTSVTGSEQTAMGVSSFRWDNAGGDPSKSVLAIQTGNELRFFNISRDDDNISNHLFYTHTFVSVSMDMNLSYAVVDGTLVVVNGEKVVHVFEYNPTDNTIAYSTRKLLIRDLFGVEDIFSGVDIGRGQDMQTRPVNYTFAHLYNLRNQSFGVPRTRANDEVFEDPATAFHSANGVWPSNTDTVTEALYADPADADNRTIDRFFPVNLFKNPLGTTYAPQGYFIIDALDRGESRLTQEENNRARYPEITEAVELLPRDETPGGATSVVEFAGRVFYAGFPGTVVDGDNRSPKMSSYILFSKIVESTADIGLCYQEGDPTSKYNADIVATDGGFLRINGAYGVQKMVNLGSSLFVFATNGVWRVFGGEDSGFTATSFIVERVSDRGCISPNSVVHMGVSVMFWGEDGIYDTSKNQFDSWACNNISFGKIQRMYDAIPKAAKVAASGSYDSFERKVRWVWNNASNNTLATKELVLDLGLQAYYTNTISRFTNIHIYPKVIATYVGFPYTVVDDPNQAVNRVTVQNREVGYICLTSVDPEARFTFCKYRDVKFRDWKSVNGGGVDAPAFLETSFISGGDFQRMKQAPYITTYLKRTEDAVDVSNPFNPLNPSSCIVQARWSWNDNDYGGKWGRPFQAYRYRRTYIPQSIADQWDNGQMLVSSRSKLRGRGRVLSLRFSTEPLKDLQLYGWSLILSMKDEP